MASISEYQSDEKNRPRSAAQIITRGGTHIYLLPVETFPGHLNNLYLIDHPDHPLLFDVGTGRPEAQSELEERFVEIRHRFGDVGGPSRILGGCIYPPRPDGVGFLRWCASQPL